MLQILSNTVTVITVLQTLSVNPGFRQYLKHVSSAVLWCDDEVDVSLVSQKWRVGYINQQPGIYQVESLLRLEARWNAGIYPATEL